MLEPTFEKNSFGQNTILTGEKALLRQIYNLLVMPQGTDTLNPHKGCDIQNAAYYKHPEDINLSELARGIKDQIITYTPYTVFEVKCSFAKKDGINYLCIAIGVLPGTNYMVLSNGKQSTITKFESPSSKLNEAINA